MADNIRAAIYTRKSSEEGLEQEFNSLDAQREAPRCNLQRCTKCTVGCLQSLHCFPEARGMELSRKGTLNRPTIQVLLQDIKDGLLNMIVVYKIDRLTRSLHDFSKLAQSL